MLKPVPCNGFTSYCSDFLYELDFDIRVKTSASVNSVKGPFIGANITKLCFRILGRLMRPNIAWQFPVLVHCLSN